MVKSVKDTLFLSLANETSRQRILATFLELTL